MATGVRTDDLVVSTSELSDMTEFRPCRGGDGATGSGCLQEKRQTEIADLPPSSQLQKTKWLWISSAEGGRKNHESQEDGADLHLDGGQGSKECNCKCNGAGDEGATERGGERRCGCYKFCREAWES